MARILLAVTLLSACASGPGQAVTAPAPAPAPAPVSAPASEPVPAPAPADRDSDGVTDDKDTCPDATGVAPDGCPSKDPDSDGVLDPDDACPTEPETRNAFQDEDGCPDQILPQLAHHDGPIKGVYFEVDKAEIKPKWNPILNAAAKILSEHPELRVEISGHADGSEKSATRLALRRAQAVQAYLVEQGIDAARLQIRGAGAAEPIEDDSSAAGRARNRRVQFTKLPP